MDPALDEQTAAASRRLRTKLLDVDPGSLPLSDYTVRHLSDKLADVDWFLGVYSSVLGLALAGHSIPLDRFVLVDHGGGPV